MAEAYIPETYFVAERTRQEEGENLAFITPDGDDDAAKKRKKTAIDWAKPYRYYGIHEKLVPDPTPNTYVITNDAQSGFVLRKNISRYTTQNVVWRVLDPRGFEIEIYSGNMNQILHETGIVNSALQGEFVYGRDGQKNILIPVGSELHDKIIEQTKVRHAPRLALTDIEVGDLCELMYCGNRMAATYAGSYYELETRAECIRWEHNWQTNTRKGIYEYSDVITKKKHMFFENFEDMLNGKLPSWDNRLRAITKPNIVSVIEKAHDVRLSVNIVDELHKLYRRSTEKTKDVRYHPDTSDGPWLFMVSDNRKELTALKNKRKEQKLTV